MAFEPAQVGLDRVHLGTRSAQLDRDGLELIFLCDDNEVVAVCVAHTVSGFDTEPPLCVAVADECALLRRDWRIGKE